MTNAIRGEVTLETNQGPKILCVTTGALAQLETELGTSITKIQATLGEGEMVTINAIIYWLLRGGGWNDLTKDDLITLEYSIKPAVEKIKQAFKNWTGDGPKKP